MDKNKVQIGSPEAQIGELPDLLEWLEKRVHRHKGSHPLDMVVLASLAAEMCEIIVRESWSFEESADEVFGSLKIWARQTAREIWEDGKRDR